MNPVLSGKQVLSSSETARMLGISVTSVRNWVRHGFISSVSADSEFFFLRDDVVSLQSRIESGELRRLSSRANKTGSSKTFIPDELFENEEDRKKVSALASMIIESRIDSSPAMLAVSLSLLAKKGMLGSASPESFLYPEKVSIRGRKNLTALLRAWVYKSSGNLNTEVLCDIIRADIPIQKNITGIIYQSILAEGEKSKLGSYYTPDKIAVEISERMYRRGRLFLDPCCGTGQFLLAFAEKYGSAENIWGIDIDPVAVNLAKVNLMLMFPDQDTQLKIFCNDSLINYNELLLFEEIDSLPEFDVIATNPPWGSHYKKDEQAKIAFYYPEITSGESFSCFLVKSARMLKDTGSLCFVLPEAVMNVRMHSDIRRFMINSCSVSRIEYMHRLFKNVFSPAVIVDIDKSRKARTVEVLWKDDRYRLDPERFRKNRDMMFDISLSPEDEAIINRIYSVKHVTLEGRATWALGIVTGNNGLFISSTCCEGYEPVIKGKDVEPFRILEGDSFIKFEPAKFQQCAPEKVFRCGEKLVYRYISDRLVFAHDSYGRLTLNSANILVPEIHGIPMKYVMGLFNSTVYQFIFRKKFNSLKVLRSHIEELPVPVISESQMKNFMDVVERMEHGGSMDELDDSVCRIFGLDEKDTRHIKKSLAKTTP
ncbi:MAG TPA: N-6 DNA methylase [Spirochaetota bacterium]|nr:N-6 DNA methylase [Spirochaetota bacterium]